MQKPDLHTEARFDSLHDKRLFVACSGGLDSICLTHLLHAQNFDVSVIHVNYQLRGEDSDGDADFVESFCAKLNIPFKKRIIDLSAQLRDGGNLQKKARDYRYNWFKEILNEDERNGVLLAHHADDQIETFFLNLGRKSGVMGLACMPYEHNGIYRPLLKLFKNDLLHYARKHGISWREDVSNSSSRYRRNLLRNEVLPFLSKNIDQLDESVLLMIQQFQEKQAELEKATYPIISDIHKTQKLSLETFEKMDEYERVELLRQLNQPASMAHELAKLLDSQKGKKVNLTDNNTYSAVVREPSSFSFMPKIPQVKKAQLLAEQVKELPKEFSKNEIYLDGKLIEGELSIRQWEIGDRMAPIGVQGTKLISAIIADAKIPAGDKEHILVLHDANTIHWCVGLKVGAKAIASPNSDQILKCSVTYSESPQ